MAKIRYVSFAVRAIDDEVYKFIQLLEAEKLNTIVEVPEIEGKRGEIVSVARWGTNKSTLRKLLEK